MNHPQGSANLLVLLAVLLPPAALDLLGVVESERSVTTPYGVVAPLALRRLETDDAVWVQPYTGLPTRTDPRATVLAARELGVTRILNWDMAVAVNPMLRRGQPVVVADYIDWTRHQPDTLVNNMRLSPGLDEPAAPPRFCRRMREVLQDFFPIVPEGVYLGVDGPRRESPAEARMFRRWGVDVIGQNLVPEVSLAHELGICYGGLVTVSQYSSDQTVAALEGEVRGGLELMLSALPPVVAALCAPWRCDCRASS